MPSERTPPPALVPGDVVAVVSPSAGSLGLYAGRADRGIRSLRRMGFEVKVMPHATATGTWVSAPVADRVSDLHDAWADPEVRAIISAIGGRGAAQLLPHLDYELIRDNPKVLCGYSDTTALHTAIGAEAGVVTFYGPSLLMELAEHPQPFPETEQAFLRALVDPAALGRIDPFDRIVTEGSDWDLPQARSPKPAPQPIVVRSGTGTGRLAGGCLPVLCELLGTPWAPDLRGCVVVLETPQRPYDARRAFTDLGHLVGAGAFDETVGLVVGWPADPADQDGLQDLLRSMVPGDLPVLFGLPTGHTSPMVTLPLGAVATLTDDVLSIDTPATTSRTP